jgi:nucleoside-diphosphate-sugar epimerase
VKILLTGASGFVGRGTLEVALQRGLDVRPVFRSLTSPNVSPLAVHVPTLDGDSNWIEALQGVDVVIHAAGLAHIMKNVLNPLLEYRRVNVEGTLNLARQSAASGVKRFVFISSIKVNGETTAPGQAFAAYDPPAPQDAYGLSKAEAEEKLKQLAQVSCMSVTIIRPPLVYGPGVKGNFGRLVNLVRRGFPLPLGGVSDNLRSFISRDNLIDLILLCAKHPNAENQIFLVSDGEDLSTSELIRRIGRTIGRPARLIRVPLRPISWITGVLGKGVTFPRLFDSLQVDIQKTCKLLDWSPSVSVDEGLRRALE